jgi:uncharacterized membrane protein YraQ (UPF0718 family)
VLPAAVALRKQGATRGATTAFLISTPESGVDSIAVTYALLDPIMTVVRPVAAFLTAMAAGIAENLSRPPKNTTPEVLLPSCPVDNCCDGKDCSPAEHAGHHSTGEKIRAGIRYAFTDLWGDIAGWFFVGIFLAGLIGVFVPDDFLPVYLGGGLSSMLLMLAVGIPIYICATASTPIAAALILKGVSPGAALVFLLAGPATNMASLPVLLKTLGRRATLLYLTAIAVCAVFFGLGTDALYGFLKTSPVAVLGTAADTIPRWLNNSAALVVIGISLVPFGKRLALRNRARSETCDGSTSCTCSHQPGAH